jgi:hypothetical protein
LGNASVIEPSISMTPSFLAITHLSLLVGTAGLADANGLSRHAQGMTRDTKGLAYARIPRIAN